MCRREAELRRKGSVSATVLCFGWFVVRSEVDVAAAGVERVIDKRTLSSRVDGFG
jgi:hypothetical protein